MLAQSASICPRSSPVQLACGSVLSDGIDAMFISRFWPISPTPLQDWGRCLNEYGGIATAAVRETVRRCDGLIHPEATGFVRENLVGVVENLVAAYDQCVRSDQCQ